jgi:hypothetical protein
MRQRGPRIRRRLLGRQRLLASHSVASVTSGSRAASHSRRLTRAQVARTRCAGLLALGRTEHPRSGTVCEPGSRTMTAPVAGAARGVRRRAVSTAVHRHRRTNPRRRDRSPGIRRMQGGLAAVQNRGAAYAETVGVDRLRFRIDARSSACARIEMPPMRSTALRPGTRGCDHLASATRPTSAWPRPLSSCMATSSALSGSPNRLQIHWP